MDLTFFGLKSLILIKIKYKRKYIFHKKLYLTFYINFIKNRYIFKKNK